MYCLPPSNMYRTSFVLLAATSVALAALAIAPLEEKPVKFKNVPGCYISELDKVLAVNSTAPSKKECMQYRCRETDVVYESCGVYVGAPKRPERSCLPYPDCCH